MKVANSFSIPEEPPVVPQRLADRVTDWLPGATKIDIQLAERGGWKVVNTIALDGTEDPTDVYSMVKCCGDHHTDETGDAGKFRALVWRNGKGRDAERKYVSFTVRSPYDDEDDEGCDPDEEIDRHHQRRGWRELYEAQQEFVTFIADYNHRATDRVLEASKQVGDHLNPLTDVVHELIGPYRDGLRMQAQAVRELGDMRVRERLAEARADDSGKFWEMFGPAVKVAATQASKRFLGDGAQKALPPGGGEPRRGAAPRASSTTTPARAPAPPPREAPAQPQADAQPVRPMPNTLHELADVLLDGMGADILVKVARVLDEGQASHFAAISEARDDDAAAESVVAFMHSLMERPAALLSMQQLLGEEHIRAFQQVAVLAKRHLQERDGATSEDPGARSSSSMGPDDTASPGKDEPSSGS